MLTVSRIIFGLMVFIAGALLFWYFFILSQLSSPGSPEGQPVTLIFIVVGLIGLVLAVVGVAIIIHSIRRMGLDE